MSSMQRWGLPVPFYFLEVLIGFVQAFVFTLLVSVYIGLICNHGDDHHEDHARRPLIFPVRSVPRVRMTETNKTKKPTNI